MTGALIAAALLSASPVPAQAPRPAEDAASARFRQFDRNGDGKVTSDELPYERLFRALDQDGDGVVTREEAAVIVERGAGQRQRWRGVDVSEGAPLPPAADFKPRAHGQEAKAAGLNADVLAKIDVEMQRHVAARNVAGIVAIIGRNGRQGYFEAFGMQDIEAKKPMPKDAIFRLMSMTKPVIAVAALTLYDEGKFTLDEPISKHCPEWAEPKVLESGQLVPARSPITPRMLMSHSSGLYYGRLEGSAGDAAAIAFRATQGKDTTLKEFSEALAKGPLKFHPGTGYQYGLSIDILGRYIEAVAGKPVDEVLKEKVFDPLGMADTGFWVPAEKADRLCQVYRQPRVGALEPGRDGRTLTEKPSLMMGGHGLSGTPGDYARFCQMLLNRGELDGKRILKAETVDLMFQNQLKDIGQRYGLGGAVDGQGRYSWGGADGTQFWIDRPNNLFAVFMVQTQGYRSPAFNDFKRLVTAAVGERE
jgi:CubicO group peptidase (beta-lactamase class C family)